MMRLQVESLAEKLYALIEDEFEVSTEEGQAVYKALVATVFTLYASQKRNASDEVKEK